MYTLDTHPPRPTSLVELFKGVQGERHFHDKVAHHFHIEKRGVVCSHEGGVVRIPPIVGLWVLLTVWTHGVSRPREVSINNEWHSPVQHEARSQSTIQIEAR